METLLVFTLGAQQEVGKYSPTGLAFKISNLCDDYIGLIWMEPFMKLLILLFLFSIPSWAHVLPKAGALCPPNFTWDGANCFAGKPVGVVSFIYDGGFYHKGNNCQLGSVYDGANCFFGKVPWNYEAFIYDNGWYVKHLPHFQGRSTDCPTDFSFDGANCSLGQAPSGHTANTRWGHFTFNRGFFKNCNDIRSGAYGLDPWTCGVKSIPSGVNPFIYNNSWYTTVVPGVTKVWFAKDNRNDPPAEFHPVCMDDTSPRPNWVLKWTDEFNEMPNGQTCYTSSAEEMKCVYKAWWGSEPCRDGPRNWTTKGAMSWTNNQLNKYLGLRNLNKCRWQVFDSFNNWEQGDAIKTGSFLPQNISIRNGTLKMKTVSHPNGPYDCGRGLLANPSQTGQEWTKNCAYSGANIQTATDQPWTNGNNPNNSNPSTRYVGFSQGYGRFEFKAKMNSIGHGAWPSLWMFVDKSNDPTQGNVEWDALELIGDTQGTTTMNANVTQGMAIQTAHNWGGNNSGLPHISSSTALPISTGVWNTFVVEWEPNEVRFYINDCLRKRIRDGESYKQGDGSMAVFRIPKNQTISILIGNPASGASWLPAWYRATLNTNGSPRSDFKPTEFEVDYVRVYGAPSRI